MRQKQFWQGFCASLGMLILILDGKTALDGARTGIDLCLKTVVPSLFPFFILSTLLTSALSGVSLPLLRPVGQLLKIPEGAESILICGFLGGYPVGAQCISAAHRAGQISTKDAERMLAFCNNAGPAFLFGMISSVFPSQSYAWTLWAIHIISAVFVALVIPGEGTGRAKNLEKKRLSISNALQSSIRIMATVCGWVILFRVVIAFLNRWILWLLPVELQVLLTGLLELSNGCCELFSVMNTKLRFLICSGILAFGGSCVTMQTISVANDIPLHFYFQGKLIQTAFSLVLSWGVLYHHWVLCFVILVVSMLILRRGQKKSSICAAIGV